MTGLIERIDKSPSWFASHFHGSSNVFLCVSDFNPRAQEFYRRIGYERVGELKNYVIPGASEILMRKTSGPKSEFVSRS